MKSLIISRCTVCMWKMKKRNQKIRGKICILLRHGPCLSYLLNCVFVDGVFGHPCPFKIR
jgi:hypothetical protein